MSAIEYTSAREGHKWALPLGLFMIVLGLIALARPVFATVASALFFGLLFIAGGVVQLAHAFRTSGAGPFILRLLVAVLYILAGIFVLQNPPAGVVSLTLAVGIFFLVTGALRIGAAVAMRPVSSWGWVLASGIITALLGIMIASQWPYNAPWVLGLLVGIGLFFDGVSLVMFYAVEHAALRRA